MKSLNSQIEPASIFEADMAWDSSVRPARIVFKSEVPPGIRDALLTVIGEYIPEIKKGGRPVLASLKPSIDPAGHYCLRAGGKKVFLRVTRRRRKNPDLEDVTAFYLSNCGIKVNQPTFTGLNILWKDRDYPVAAFPFMEGRHFNGSDDDLKAAVAAIRLMHKALKSFKFVKRVKANAIKTADSLHKIKIMIADSLKKDDFSMYREGAGWARDNASWLNIMAEEFNPYLCKLPGAQCIHGEPHLGNIIFSNRNGSAMITDFEEVPDSYFPPAFDLAYICHRFCMDGAIKDKFRHRLNVVKNAYGALPGNLGNMLRQVCWYNIALIIYRTVSRESFVPAEEYEKFVKLERLSLEVNGWLCRES